MVLETKGLRRAFGDNVVLKSVDLMVERGDRIALVGPNGAGKSTLMRLLAGVDRPDGGTRIDGHNVVLSYFAQDQAAVLNPLRTVHEEMSAASSTTMVPMIRSILGGFLFEGDDVLKKVAVLSGGERNRLAIAKMLLQPSNLLLLDEPTNHLDLDSKEVLLDALADYGGTLIFVSHDRYFVDRLATRVIEVGGGETLDYPGGYEDFLHWKKLLETGTASGVPSPSSVQLSAAPPQPSPRPGPPSEAAKKSPASSTPHAKPVPVRAETPKPKASAPPRDPLAPRLRKPDAPPDRQALEREVKRMRNRLTELEKRIAEQEKAVKDLEIQMASDGFYEDRARAATAADDHQRLMWEVGDLMGQWEALQAEVDEKQALLPDPRPNTKRS